MLFDHSFLFLMRSQGPGKHNRTRHKGGAPLRFSRTGTELEAHNELGAGGLEHERGISTFDSRFGSELACWSVL